MSDVRSASRVDGFLPSLETRQPLPKQVHRVPSVAVTLADVAQTLAQVTDTPRLDAELLLEHATGRNRTRLRAEPEWVLQPVELQQLQQLVERRRRGEPLAYILGKREFWSLELQVDARVLVPRPDTELLVERALVHLPTNHRCEVLDLGTGSGAIALAIARERPLAHVAAADVSRAALEIAALNARRLNLAVQFFQSDWYAALAPRRFDLIVSNPPYIAEGDPDLDPSVLANEPRAALIAGRTGLEAIEQIVAGAPRFLKSAGWLLLEHGWLQAEAVRRLLVSAGFSGVASHADLAGRERATEGQCR